MASMSSVTHAAAAASISLLVGVSACGGSDGGTVKQVNDETSKAVSSEMKELAKELAKQREALAEERKQLAEERKKGSGGSAGDLKSVLEEDRKARERAAIDERQQRFREETRKYNAEQAKIKAKQVGSNPFTSDDDDDD